MPEGLSYVPPEVMQKMHTESLVDLSQELYEGGKADPSKIGEYVKIAQEKGLLNADTLDLTGGTLMNIYAAISAEAGKPGSSVQEIAFNNPSREGRVVLYNQEIAEKAGDEPERNLMDEAPASIIDPQAPTEVLDLRLTFADEPESGQQMADVKQAEKYMQNVIAQLRALKKKGVTTVRITGIPMWLAEGGYFAGAKEGMDRLISYTMSSEMIVYDAKDPSQVGRTEMRRPQEISVDLSNVSIDDINAIRSGRQLQEFLGIEISRNNIDYQNLDVAKIKPEVALRLFDSTHSFSSSAKLAGVEIFQHLDFRSHDLVPKNPRNNPELLPAQQREAVTLDVHQALQENNGDVDATALALAKQAVNRANKLTFTNITNATETAIAGKVAHAAHGLLTELCYQDERGEHLVKSWTNKNEVPQL